jgi:hypothetical protein
MRKNWIALAVSLTLSAGMAGAFAAQNFSDVKSSWAQNDINKAVDHNIMSGYNDGMFHPDAWVSRQDFVQMAGKTLGLAPDQSSTVPSFNSVAQNAWGFGNVDNQAWLSSYPSGVAQPDNPVRRVEALSSLAGVLNKPVVSSEQADKILSKYNDAALIPVSSRADVATAIEYKLFEVDPKSGKNMIDPLRPVTRAETAALMENLYDKRDIAIVQNGQMVANATPNGAGVPSGAVAAASQQPAAGTTTTGTSAVSGANETNTGTTTTGENTTTTPGTTGATGSTGNETGTEASNVQNPEVVKQIDKVGYRQFSTGGNALAHSAIPYRNSADTIPVFRSVNVTPAPTGMDASVPVTLAPNTTFMGTVAKSLYSDFNRPGDPAMLILDHPVYDANGRVIAPAGSQVVGFVDNVVSRNFTNDNAQIGITFNGFITPSGQIIPINAKINNTNGILKAGELQGIVFTPAQRSVEALRREISTSTGSNYGSIWGKAGVLDQPQARQVSSRPLDPIDISSKDLLIGVGDRIQVRLDAAGPGTNLDNVKMPGANESGGASH